MLAYWTKRGTLQIPVSRCDVLVEGPPPMMSTAIEEIGPDDPRFAKWLPFAVHSLLDEIDELADPRRPVGVSRLSAWDEAAVKADGRAEYNAYSKTIDAAYTEYFSDRPDEAGAHPRKAASLEKALPPGLEFLAAELPKGSEHQHYLSGRSSQVAALSLLGAGRATDQSLAWLFSAFGSLPGPIDRIRSQFEYTVAPGLLGERPRQTSIDFYAEGSELVLAVECKLGEAGLGTCSCDKPAQLTGSCKQRVLERSAYWDAARELFLLPDRVPGELCPISLGYQAIRNVAAVKALAADGRIAVFGLIYDARNPYFSGVGDWPGWPAVLTATLADQDQVLFRSASWQDLLGYPALTAVRQWAQEKHGLVAIR